MMSSKPCETPECSFVSLTTTTTTTTTMGRNKNKHNRSAARQKPSALQAGGARLQTGARKDTGLPTFFKQRRQQERSNAAATAMTSARTTGASRRLGEDVGVTDDGRRSMLIELADAQKDDVMSTDDVFAAAAAAASAAASSSSSFEKASRELALSGKRDNSVKAFMRDVKNVIENSDVLLEVLDARDPLGSRSRQTETLAMACGKKVVLVLNKVDLIPTTNMQAWLRYLRNDFPTLAFKASTQQQRTHLKQGRGEIDVRSTTRNNNERQSFGSEAIGANALLQLLKNYARTAVKGSNVKHQLTVGVVGPPNVGKSSLINSLLRTRACAVASTPGWTKAVQGVMLEKGIRLLDCPGVVVTNDDGDNNEDDKDATAWNMLRNTVKVELLDDPIAPVQAILRRVDDEQLVELYNIEGGFNHGDAYDFLLRIALLRGKLAKGGVPDLEGAARIVLHDWNVGRIAFHSTPPTVHRAMLRQQEQQPETTNVDSNTAGTSFVSGFSEAFDIASLLGQADAEALGLGGDKANGQSGRDLITARERVYATSSAAHGGDGEQPIEVEEDDEKRLQLDTSISTLGKRRRGADDDEMLSSDDDDDDNYAKDDDDDDDGHMRESDDEDRRRDALSMLSRGRLTAPRDVAVEATAAKRETMLSRQQRELQRALGEHEVASMARRRGDVRRSAKKEQKRLRKSGAGLVDVWTSAMALGEEDDDDDETTDAIDNHNNDKVADVALKERKSLFSTFSVAERPHSRDVVQESEEEL